MKYFVLLQKLGDNLITLQMLSQLKERVNIFATQGTKDIANMLGITDSFNIVVVFDEVPSFYRVREKGVIRALVDILRFRATVKKFKPSNLIFEKGGVRAKMLSYGLSEASYSEVTKNAYLGRKFLIEKVSNSIISLRSSVPPKKIHNILICPSSGHASRNISKRDLKCLIKIFRERGYNVNLIDHSGEYGNFEVSVNQYFSNTSLIEAKEIILNNDFFVGTDSFLIHLAYFYGKSFFIMFNYEYFDFLPPGCEVLGNYVVTNPLKDNEEEIRNKLSFLKVV